MSAEEELAAFLARLEPEAADVAQAAVAKLRARFPTADVLVYDNYNALAVGFASSERASEAVFSIAVYPRHASLFFFQHGHELADPAGRLRGSGKTTRHVVLGSADDLDAPEVEALIEENLARAETPFRASGAGTLVVKSVSSKQRPRRPTGRRGRPAVGGAGRSSRIRNGIPLTRERRGR